MADHSTDDIEDTTGEVSIALSETTDTTQNSSTYKVLGEIATPDGTGVLGHNTATSGTAYGLEGVTDSPHASAAGLRGRAPNGGRGVHATASTGIGILSHSTDGPGVQASSDANYGGFFSTGDGGLAGLRALNFATSNPESIGYGVRASTDAVGSGAAGIYGEASEGSGQTYGVRGISNSPDGYGLATPDDAKVGGTLVAGAIQTPSLPRYDGVGNDPEEIIDALDHLFEATWADGVTFRAGPDPGEGLNAFWGGVLAPTGDVVFIPDNSDFIGLYDPLTDSYTSGAAHNEINDQAFKRGALSPGGSIILAPYRSDNVGVYDAGPDIYTSGDSHGEGDFAFDGAALAPTGEVVFAPSSSSVVGTYDPETDRYTSGDNHGEGGAAFEGAVLSPTGDVVFVPNNSSNVGIYDPSTNTYTSGDSHNEGANPFGGGALAPTGDVIFAPRESNNVGIYDPVNDTYTSGDSHGEGNNAFKGATLAPTGIITFAPRESSNIGIYDPATDTYTSGPSHGQARSLVFTGATLAPTGDVVLVPQTGSVGQFYTFARTDNPLSTSLHPLVN